MTSLTFFDWQVDSMLPCVCSVIDHRRRQNVVGILVTHSPNGSCATFLFLPYFEVICDLLLPRRTATWNLFIKESSDVNYWFPKTGCLNLVKESYLTVFIQSTSSHLRPWPTMDSKLFCSLILCQGFVNCFVFAVEENSTSSRSAYLMTQENKRLEGHVVKRLESDSLMSCSHLCLRNACCTSTNFEATSSENGRGNCELNKHGAINTDSELYEQQGVTFSMLQKGIKNQHSETQ